jgi:hypothetical protein
MQYTHSRKSKNQTNIEEKHFITEIKNKLNEKKATIIKAGKATHWSQWTKQTYLGKTKEF